MEEKAAELTESILAVWFQKAPALQGKVIKPLDSPWQKIKLQPFPKGRLHVPAAHACPIIPKELVGTKPTSFVRVITMSSYTATLRDKEETRVKFFVGQCSHCKLIFWTVDTSPKIILPWFDLHGRREEQENGEGAVKPNELPQSPA